MCSIFPLGWRAPRELRQAAKCAAQKVEGPALAIQRKIAVQFAMVLTMQVVLSQLPQRPELGEAQQPGC